MGKLKLLLAALVLSVGLFSCSPNNEFAKVRYLDKTYAKKQKLNFKPEKLENEAQAKADASEKAGKNDVSDKVTASTKVEILEIIPGHFQKNAKKASNKASEKKLALREGLVSSELQVPEMNMEEVFSTVVSKKGTKKKNGRSGILGLNVIGTVLLIILAIFIPPLAVLIDRGLEKQFWINLLLSILFYSPIFFLPALAFLPIIPIGHAILVILDVI